MYYLLIFRFVSSIEIDLPKYNFTENYSFHLNSKTQPGTNDNKQL